MIFRYVTEKTTLRQEAILQTTPDGLLNEKTIFNPYINIQEHSIVRRVTNNVHKYNIMGVSPLE